MNTLNPLVRSDLLEHHDIEVGDCIGEGTYARVFCGLRRSTKEKVAIKQCRSELDNSHYYQIRECSILHQLKKLFETVPMIGDTMYLRTGYLPIASIQSIIFHPLDHMVVSIIMPHYSSPNLELYARRCKGISPNLAIQYLSQILYALHECHKIGILHRDIKANNILLSDNLQRVYLCDFGMAKFRFCRSTAPTLDVVAFDYRAPELLVGDDNYDGGIDLWALACTMYECVTTQRLFREQRHPKKLIQEQKDKTTYKSHLQTVLFDKFIGLGSSKECAVLASTLTEMLTYDNKHRPSATTVLQKLLTHTTQASSFC